MQQPIREDAEYHSQTWGRDWGVLWRRKKRDWRNQRGQGHTTKHGQKINWLELMEEIKEPAGVWLSSAYMLKLSSLVFLVSPNSGDGCFPWLLPTCGTFSPTWLPWPALMGWYVPSLIGTCYAMFGCFVCVCVCLVWFGISCLIGVFCLFACLLASCFNLVLLYFYFWERVGEGWSWVGREV